MTIISLFALTGMKDFLFKVCGAALSVSMFAAIFQLIIGGSLGSGAQKISTWCLRGTAIITAIAVIAGYGVRNILSLLNA